MTCPPGRVNTSDQLLRPVAPVLVMVMLAVRPVFQAFTTSDTRQAAAGCGDDGVGDVGEDGETEGDTDGETDGDTDGEMLGDGDVPPLDTRYMTTPCPG